MLRVLSLFSGIGAYDLGLERTGGFKTVAFCEIEDFPVRVLNKHWPKVPVYRDVRTLTADTLRRDGIAVDVIVGGWPCQGNSPAGTGLGMDDPRSGLWSEVARLAGELRPRFLILENSSNVLGINDGADFGRILGDVAALGYDAEWHCLPAAAFDAPHIRDRVWIVAHRRRDAPDANPHGERQSQGREQAQREWPSDRGEGAIAADDARDAKAGSEAPRRAFGKRTRPRGKSPRAHETNASGERRDSFRAEPEGEPRRPRAVTDAFGFPSFGAAIARSERDSWRAEPDVARVVHGASDRVDRIHALGNCNPPQIIEAIGRALLTQEQP